MDYQSLIQLILKKVTPFLLSVSIFSFIFSNSSWHSFLGRSFKFYFSSIPMQVLSHAFDKSWIFLICNGILVVIANTSGNGMAHSLSGSDLNDLVQNKIGDSLQTLPEDSTFDVSVPENAVPKVEEEEEEEEKENEAPEEEEREDECMKEDQKENSLITADDNDEKRQESRILKTGVGEEEDGAETQELQIACIAGDHEEDDEEETNTCFMIEEEDQEQLYDEGDQEQEEEEGIEKLSTEELNKKFEDFIRKMKEELRIEAQQQLVLVK